MCSPPRCAQGPACSPRLPWRMLEYSTAYSPCPSMATALLYCNCHLALACPHCTATPASLRLTALPLACPHLLRLACIACCVCRTFLRYRSGGALRIRSESPLHRPDVVNVVRRHGSACRRRGACVGQCACSRFSADCALAQIATTRPARQKRTLRPAPQARRDTGNA